MIYLIIAIIILTIILYFILKDLFKLLRITSIITITSGYLTIITGYITRNILNSQITIFNISKITGIIFDKNLRNGLILILIGAIELITYVIINVYRNYSTVKAAPV